MVPKLACWTAAFCALVTLARGAGAIEIHQVTRARASGSIQIVSYDTPAWSSDGQSLLAAANGVEGTVPYYEIYWLLVALDLDGNLLDTPSWSNAGGYVTRPSSNPMQTRFAFGCHVNLTCVGVCVVDPAAVYWEAFPCLDSAHNPAWSPDGLTIVAETSLGLRMFSPSGDAGVQLTTRHDDQMPAWSPDGKEIVFSSTQGGGRDLWIQNVVSGEVRQLTSDAAVDTWPAWSPDGGWIAFASDRDGPAQIWAIPATGGNPIRISDTPWSSAPAWSPDGRSLAFESQDQIWVATGLDVLVSVEAKSWSNIKTLYRDANR